MPLYDFTCKACGHVFESLTRAAERDSARPACPSCASADGAERNSLAAFAVGASSAGSAGFAGSPDRFGGPPAGGCGTCGDPRGPGACRTN